MSLKKLKASKQVVRTSGRGEEYRHYSKAPLTEAVLDIRVELLSEITLQELAKVQSGQEKQYPKKDESLLVVGQMSMGSQVSASASQTPNGYRFTSQDNRQIFQARIDGFTFSRLAPYETWDSFRDEARRLWELYRPIAKPKNITRLALRYINKLDLPLPLGDFKDYLRTVPEISPDMTQGLSGYFMQLQLPQADLDALLVLNQTLIPPPEPSIVSVVLDFDLFCKDNVPNEDQDIWKRFEVLRKRKNKVFEACITDKTRRLIT